jgi:hypothetical protein
MARQSNIRRKKKNQIDVMIDYLKLKLDQRDWHGVSDAANDLRVMEERVHRNKRP